MNNNIWTLLLWIGTTSLWLFVIRWLFRRFLVPRSSIRRLEQQVLMPIRKKAITRILFRACLVTLFLSSIVGVVKFHKLGNWQTLAASLESQKTKTSRINLLLSLYIKRGSMFVKGLIAYADLPMLGSIFLAAFTIGALLFIWIGVLLKKTSLLLKAAVRIVESPKASNPILGLLVRSIPEMVRHRQLAPILKHQAFVEAAFLWYEKAGRDIDYPNPLYINVLIILYGLICIFFLALSLLLLGLS